MRIRTRLLVGIAMSAVASLAVGALLLVNFGTLVAGSQNGHRSQQVTVKVVQLTTLTHDVAVHGDPEALTIWRERDAEIGTLLGTIETGDAEQAATLADMRSTHAEIGALFDRLVAARSAPGEAAPALSATVRQLGERLAEREGELGSKSAALHESITRRIMTSQQRTAVLGFLLVVAALGLSTTMSWRAADSISRGLHRLRVGAEAIATGDLATRVCLECKYELGELGESFNAMAERLSVSYQSLANEIAERRRAEEIITRMAYFDPLTGLANRSLFNDRLELCVAHAQRHAEGLAVMFVDVDQFKQVNDTLGHTFGDRLLKEIAERLRACVRGDDTISRYGGDEFTVLLSNIDSRRDVEGVAKKLLETMDRPFVVDGHEVHVTASIGVAMWPDGGHTGEELLKNADAAMYEAKESGPNRYRLYHPSMSEEAEVRFALKNELRRAITERRLFVEYQPQVAIDDGRIVGGEALVRWDHPVRGLLGPHSFIPLAEEAGLIVPLGEWVLREACSQARAWRETLAPDFRVAVNLSAVQFVRGDIVRTVENALADTGLPAEALELEITETIAMRNTPQLLDTLDRLRDLGVRVALDDFGIGYSSLGYLQRLPIHTLKIAGPFVEGVCTSPESAAIANTIIDLATSLDLNVVAEGVECEDQLAFLRGSGCREWQGFLFAPPMAPETFSELLAGRALCAG